jgi:hypothetical protein
VRPLSYQEADVFLLCYKISDPISLYNVKNKWIRELRRHRTDAPVILCGCQSDLRSDALTVAHLGKTGRAPVSQEQALAICCEIEALHYVETSAKTPDRDNVEAFEVCALAAMKHHNSAKVSASLRSSTFQRSPSIHSSLSLFEPPESTFKRSPSTHSSLSLSAHTPTSGRIAFPFPVRKAATPLNSPSSFSDCESRLSSFSPEPALRVLPGPGTGPLCYVDAPRIPPAISENEAYQDGHDFYSTLIRNPLQSGKPMQRRSKLQRPSSLCDAKQMLPNLGEFPSQPASRLQRPTTLFKSASPSQAAPSFPSFSPSIHIGHMYTSSSSSTIFTPTADPRHRLLFFQPKSVEPRRFDSLSELGTPTSLSSTSELMSPQFSAQIRPNNLGRRTSYRTYQKVPIPVAAPMSPIGTASECSFDLKSPEKAASRGHPFPAASPALPESSSETVSRVYESLKSQTSTCSQGSTGSKMSFSELSQSDSSSVTPPLRPIGECDTLSRSLPEKGIPDTEDPELLKKLSFVSPKSGVFRPVPDLRRSKPSCSVM